MDAYTTLGLFFGAGDEEVKKAYKGLAKRSVQNICSLVLNISDGN